jgi:hypothetical protein
MFEKPLCMKKKKRMSTLKSELSFCKVIFKYIRILLRALILGLWAIFQALSNVNNCIKAMAVNFQCIWRACYRAENLWPCSSVRLPYTKIKFNMRLKMRINRAGHWALSVVMWRALVWCQTLCASNRSLTKWTIRPIKSYSLFPLSIEHPKMHTLLLSILFSRSLQNGFTY